MLNSTILYQAFDRGDANNQTREQAIVDFGNDIFEGKLPRDIPSLIDAWEQRKSETPTFAYFTEAEYYDTSIYHELGWEYKGALMAATVYALGEQFDMAEQEQTGKPLSPEELIAKIAALVYEYKLDQNTSQGENEVSQSAIISLLTAELLEVPARYRLLQNSTNQPIDWQNYALLFGGELPQIKTKKKTKRRL